MEFSSNKQFSVLLWRLDITLNLLTPFSTLPSRNQFLECQSKMLHVKGASKFLSPTLFQSHWWPAGCNFGAAKYNGSLCFQVFGLQGVLQGLRGLCFQDTHAFLDLLNINWHWLMNTETREFFKIKPLPIIYVSFAIIWTWCLLILMCLIFLWYF